MQSAEKLQYELINVLQEEDGDLTELLIRKAEYDLPYEEGEPYQEGGQYRKQFRVRKLHAGGTCYMTL